MPSAALELWIMLDTQNENGTSVALYSMSSTKRSSGSDFGKRPVAAMMAVHAAHVTPATRVKEQSHAAMLARSSRPIIRMPSSSLFSFSCTIDLHSHMTDWMKA